MKIEQILLKEFKTVIVPGVFKKSFEEVPIVKSTELFAKYLKSLEDKNIITTDISSKAENLFIKIIKRG